MRLRYFLYVVFITFFITSCNKEDRKDDSNKADLSNPRIVSKELAQNFATMFKKAKLTESGLKSAAETLSIDKVDVLTKDDDTLMYSINFNGNNGYVIISADKNSFPILSYSNKGIFDVSDKVSGSNGWLDAQKQDISEDIKEPLDTTDENYKLWSNFEVSFSDTSVLLSVVDNSSSNGLKSSIYLPYIMPMTSQYQWGQGTGYNYFCPQIGTQKTLVGCVAVAMGIVNHYIRFTPQWPNDWYWWYINDYCLPKIYADQPTELALMLHDIGVAVNMNYGIYESTADGYDNIVNAFKSFGYVTGGSAISYNLTDVYNSLRNNRPVILLAYNNMGKGHAWVTDGYGTVTIKTVKKRIWPFKDIVSYSYKGYLSMNWGWDGNNNGFVEESNWNYLNYNRGAIVDIY